MKRVFLLLFVALVLLVVTALPALALDLELPNGKTVEGLPDEAENAGNSGIVVPDDCVSCGIPSCTCDPPCVPPCDGGGI